VSVTDPPWFAVQTWPRYEKKVASELQDKAIEVFPALRAVEHEWSDRRRIIQLPLFPGYIFARIPERFDSQIAVLRTTGVAKLVGARNVGTPIPDGEIESVRILLNRSVAFRNHPFLNVGQRVRIRGGSLNGVEGILSGKNEDLSLIVSIQMLQRSLAIRLLGCEVEAA
jgi:transcription antitermination factor NusG